MTKVLNSIDENEKKKRYKHGKYWKFTTARIEEIIIKDESTFYDTIIYTHHGPIVGDFNYFPKDSSIHIEKNYGLALQWTAHDSTNELLTFYLLNRASNYDEFEQSLKIDTAGGPDAKLKGDRDISNVGRRDTSDA